MRMNQRLFLLLFVSAALFIACSEDVDDSPVLISQAELDAVSVYIGSWTGGQMAHGGPEGTSADSTVREVYATSDLTGSIPTRTIITKNTHKRGLNGNASDQIYVSFALVKREAGYYPDGGDYEFIMMPNDGSVDYSKHPFGMLPEEESEMRGKLNMCATCHADAEGGDFIFGN